MNIDKKIDIEKIFLLAVKNHIVSINLTNLSIYNCKKING